jgi:hypothetical protein
LSGNTHVAGWAANTQSLHQAINGCTCLQQSGTVLREYRVLIDVQLGCVIRLVDDCYPLGSLSRFMAWNLLFSSLIRAVRAR